ncbi:MAG TPA: hypothetical protein VFB19_18435 [Mycobacterium sp.]|nr:hypothetical protein [Mycobacterium sp.]
MTRLRSHVAVLDLLLHVWGWRAAVAYLLPSQDVPVRVVGRL